MKKFIKFIGLALFSFLVFTACSSQNGNGAQPEGNGEESVETQGQAGQFVVAVPVEMEEAMKAIAASFPQGEGMTIIADKSGVHQKSIEEGSDIDVFISGDKKQMDTLVQKELIEADSVSNLAEQELVLIQDKTSTPIQSVEEIPNVEGKIAVGDINTVPVGRFAQEALINLGLWNKIQDKIHYLNAAQTVIANVEQGNSDVGFVYRSNMREAQNSSIIASVDSGAYNPILLPVGIIKDQDQGEKANEFAAFLKDAQAQEILKSNGFKLIEQEPVT